MRRLKNKLIRSAKNVRSALRRGHLPDRYVHYSVPYYSQWETPELVEAIINGKTDSREDPLWRHSGAANQDEYAEWSRNGCGMACLKMILGATRNETIPLVTLGEKGVEYGAYRLPLDDSPGMFYGPFVRYIQAEFGLKGKASAALTVSEIKGAIAHDGFVIASVTPEIRFPNKPPKRRGGHLVLLFGYDDEKQTFYLHNPSGFDGTREALEISYKNFAKFFDHKGIIVT